MDSEASTQKPEASRSSSPESHTIDAGSSVAAADSNSQNAENDQETVNNASAPVCKHKPTTPWLDPGFPRRYGRQNKGLSAQAHFVLRRSRLTRRNLVHRQIVRGRGDPSKAWCNDKDCNEDGGIFRNPFVYIVDRRRSRLRIPPKEYFQDFVDAMVEKLSPSTETDQAKVRRARGWLSFVDSPPVRAAFWKFTRSLLIRRIKVSTEEMQAALVKARPVFQDLLFGVKTTARAHMIHSYINPEEEELYETWTLHEFILRFLVCSELWRQHKTPRSASWVIGSREEVSEFLMAMMLNYRLMWKEDCFKKEVIHVDQCWDQVWEAWLDKYPMENTGEGDDEEEFQIRDQLSESEEAVLEEVGYLGGLGKHDDSYRPVQRELGDHEYAILKYHL